MLLDRPELRRGLGLDRAQEVPGLLRVEVGGAQVLGLARVVAALDLVADAELAEGAQLEALILGEVPVPVVDQEGVVGDELVPLPQHPVVVLLRQSRGPEAHLSPISTGRGR